MSDKMYTVYDIEKFEDVMISTKKDDIIEFLVNRRLDRFRIDILEYKPVQRHVSAKQFINEQHMGIENYDEF